MFHRFDTTCPICHEPVTLQLERNADTPSGYELSGFCGCIVPATDAVADWCEWADDLESRSVDWWEAEIQRQQIAANIRSGLQPALL